MPTTHCLTTHWAIHLPFKRLQPGELLAHTSVLISGEKQEPINQAIRWSSNVEILSNDYDMDFFFVCTLYFFLHSTFYDYNCEHSSTVTFKAYPTYPLLVDGVITVFWTIVKSAVFPMIKVKPTEPDRDHLQVQENFAGVLSVTLLIYIIELSQYSSLRY